MSSAIFLVGAILFGILALATLSFIGYLSYWFRRWDTMDAKREVRQEAIRKRKQNEQSRTPSLHQ